MGDRLRRRPARGPEVQAARVGDGEQRHLAHAFGDAQDLARLLLADEMQRGERAAEPAAAQRELEAPHGGQDGSVEHRGHRVARPFEPPLDARDHVHRDAVQVLCQELGGIDDALGLGIGPVALARVLADVGREGAVEVGHARARPLVVHDDPGPGLGVARRGSLLRQSDAVEQDAALHRPLEIQTAPHGAGGREQPVRGVEIEGGVHGLLRLGR